MRVSCLLLTPAILCGLACSSDSLGVTDQQQVEADLVGSWSQVVTAREEQQVIELTVSDTIVTGVGHWSGEAIAGGNITVTGHITGSQVDLFFLVMTIRSSRSRAISLRRTASSAISSA